MSTALPPASSFRLGALSLLAYAMEAIVLVMVCASPWAYGAVHPGFEFLLYACLGVILLLWAARMLLAGQLSWQKCPVALCLAGLVLIGLWQLTPLSGPVLKTIAP